MIERKTEKCKVGKIVYPKGSEVPQGIQFYIINTDIGTIKGKLSWTPLPEERLSLFGAWKTHPSYGRFFEFVTGRHDIPDDERAMLKYACELTKGIGEITEGDIWNAKGESWRELSIEDKVPRITPRVLTAFKETIEHLGLQQEKLDVISYLISKGATTRMAESAWEKWADSTITKVQTNCYVLAELKNFSFRDVDERISQHFGIGEEDPRRIVAAVDYFMKQLSQSSTLVTWRELKAKVEGAIRVTPKLLSDTVRGMFNDERLQSFPEVQSLAIRSIFDDEKLIFNFVNTGRGAMK